MATRTPRAPREIIDNAIEAGAKNVWITFKRPAEEDRGKRSAAMQCPQSHSSTTVPGCCLRWHGTHSPGGWHALRRPDRDRAVRIRPAQFEHQPDPPRRGLHANCCQAAVDCAVLDINSVEPHGLIKVAEPQVADPPPVVAQFRKKNKVNLKPGTVVVWDKSDRVTARSRRNCESTWWATSGSDTAVTSRFAES